jgi:hypothetical protein
MPIYLVEIVVPAVLIHPAAVESPIRGIAQLLSLGKKHFFDMY